MSSDNLRPEEIDAAIEAAQQQNPRQGVRLEPEDLTRLEADYRLRVRSHTDEEEAQVNDETDGSEIPTYPGRRRPDIAYSDLDQGAEDAPRRRRLLPKLIAGLALLAFAGIIWWAYGTETPGDPGSAPLITADEGAVKFRPKDEGGMEVPNQDKLIYSQIGGGRDSEEPQVERLLPPPEAPVEPPSPPAVSTLDSPAQGAAEGAAEGAAREPGADPEPASAAAAPAVPDRDAPAETAMADAPSPTAAAEPAGPQEGDAAPADRAESGATAEPTPLVPAKTAEPAVVEAPATPESKAPPAAEPAAQVAAATSGYRVQLAALRSRDAAQAEWGNLQRRFPALLKQLQVNLQHVDLGDKGVFYRVQAGPLPDREAARALCNRFQEQKQACLVVAP